MARFARLNIHKEEFSFSAGHFTIFSATEREHLHGHNYAVSISFNVKIEHNGLSFDYRYYKRIIQSLCDHLDRRFLLPGQSPYLTLQDDGEYCIARFNHKNIPFLKEDVAILPLSNITIEELAHWFLEQLLQNATELERHAIHGITIQVYNGPGQSGGTTWGNIS